MKHTPGPWHIFDGLEENPDGGLVCAGKRGICTLNPIFPSQANACLITAAPDLLRHAKRRLNAYQTQRMRTTTRLGHGGGTN